MARIAAGNVPYEMRSDGGTLINYGPGTVYIADNDDVTTSSYDAKVLAGDSLAVDGSIYLVSDTTTDVGIVAPVEETRNRLPGQRLATFGHSYNDPNYMVGVAVKRDLYGQRLAQLLGMVEDNYCVSGSYSIQGTGNAYDRAVVQLPAPPTTPPLRSPVNAAAIYSGHNDISPSLQTTIATEPSILIDFLRAIIHRLRSGQAAHVGAAPMVLAGGTWTTTSSASWFGGSLRFATANGCTWTLTLPATFPGGTLEIWGMRNSATGAVHTVTVGGQAWGTFDTRGATTVTNRPTLIELTDLPAGSSVVQGTVSNLVGGVEHLNYWQIPHPDPPPIAFANVCRTPSAANGQTDGVVATFIPLYRALAAEFTDGRVALVDADLVLNKDSTLFGDGTHPSARGAALLAEAFADAMMPMLNRRAGLSVATDQALGPAFHHGFFVDESVDPRSGQVTLVAGAATITSRAIQSNSRILLTPIGAGTGSISRGTITATNNNVSGSCAVASSDAADTRVVQWLLVQPQ